ncbi:uncharacterized protein LOC134685611 [Mytilus trossulus]|uniref:uncharacterized protein LOC134685611 n=1 Tax=Mytilus trossulus TaxID=6551 RepID=UPI003005CB68
MLPSMLLILACGIGIILKTLHDHYKCLSKLRARRKIQIEDELQWMSDGPDIMFYQGIIQVKKNRNTKKAFLSPFDQEVMESMKTFKHSTTEFIQISIPALATMIIGPLMILMYHSTTEFFWSLTEFPTMPNINQCVSCFLTPAGLVYALSFGFAFQQALAKQNDVLNKMTTEISFLDQIATLTCKVNFKTNGIRANIYRALKSEAIYMMTLVQNRKVTSFNSKPDCDISIDIWNLLDLLRETNRTTEHYVDSIMVRYIIDYTSILNSVCSDQIGILHSKINWLLWTFLVTLGFFSLYGVIMIQAFSYKMELMLCTLTLFSIGMLCYIVADLDSPFTGIFRIDLSILIDVIRRIEIMCTLEESGRTDLVYYPDSSYFNNTE